MQFIRKKRYKSRGDCLLARQSDEEAAKDYWEKMIELEKDYELPIFSTNKIFVHRW